MTAIFPPDLNGFLYCWLDDNNLLYLGGPRPPLPSSWIGHSHTTILWFAGSIIEFFRDLDIFKDVLRLLSTESNSQDNFCVPIGNSKEGIGTLCTILIGVQDRPVLETLGLINRPRTDSPVFQQVFQKGSNRFLKRFPNAFFRLSRGGRYSR